MFIYSSLDTLRLAIEKVAKIPQGSQILMTSEGLQLKQEMMFEAITSSGEVSSVSQQSSPSLEEHFWGQMALSAHSWNQNATNTHQCDLRVAVFPASLFGSWDDDNDDDHKGSCLFVPGTWRTKTGGKGRQGRPRKKKKENSPIDSGTHTTCSSTRRIKSYGQSAPCHTGTTASIMTHTTPRTHYIYAPNGYIPYTSSHYYRSCMRSSSKLHQ
jgi:hypothetical protein